VSGGGPGAPRRRERDFRGREVVIQNGVQARRLLAHAGEPLHPDPVADQQMVQGSMQRFEIGAAVGAVIGVGEEGGCVIEPLVAPGVIGGKHAVAGMHPLAPF
jgi:hypothetical protein